MFPLKGGRRRGKKRQKSDEEKAKKSDEEKAKKKAKKSDEEKTEKKAKKSEELTEEDMLQEVEDAMEAESGEKPWGGVGCYDGKVLICVFPENFVEEHDDEDGAAIAKKCIQAHEDAHGHQCKCDKKGKGLKKPQNDLKSDAHEGAALGAEIECYAGSSCADVDDPEACQAVLDYFKADACTQYEERMGEAHSSC